MGMGLTALGILKAMVWQKHGDHLQLVDQSCSTFNVLHAHAALVFPLPHGPCLELIAGYQSGRLFTTATLAAALAEVAATAAAPVIAAAAVAAAM